MNSQCKSTSYFLRSMCCWLVVLGAVIAGTGSISRGEQSPPQSKPASEPLFPTVEAVIASSVAERTGFRVGDQIIAYGDQSSNVTSIEAFRNLVGVNSGRVTEAIVVRNGASIKLLAMVPRGQNLGVSISLRPLAPKPITSNKPANEIAAKVGAAALRVAVRVGTDLARPEPVPVPEVPHVEVPDPVTPVIESGDDGGILEEVIEFLLEVFGL